jgi:hypothetical protein
VQQRLQLDVDRYPAIAPQALAAAAGFAPFLQLVFVAGAIGGHAYPASCTLARDDPTAFATAARARLFHDPRAETYVTEHGLTSQSVVDTYVRGVLFG